MPGTPDAKPAITVELESGALLALTDEDETAAALAVPHDVVASLRVALRTTPDWRPDRGHVYRVSIRREQAEALRRFCEDAGRTLATLPDPPDQQRASALAQAQRDLGEALAAGSN